MEYWHWKAIYLQYLWLTSRRAVRGIVMRIRGNEHLRWRGKRTTMILYFVDFQWNRHDECSWHILSWYSFMIALKPSHKLLCRDEITRRAISMVNYMPCFRDISIHCSILRMMRHHGHVMNIAQTTCSPWHSWIQLRPCFSQQLSRHYAWR